MNYIKHLPVVLLTIFCGKALFVGLSYENIAVIGILSAISCFFEYKSQNIEIEKINRRCEAIDKHLTDLYKANQEINSQLASIKTFGQLRNVGQPRQ